jgi:hypothetical protein
MFRRGIRETYGVARMDDDVVPDDRFREHEQVDVAGSVWECDLGRDERPGCLSDGHDTAWNGDAHDQPSFTTIDTIRTSCASSAVWSVA